MPTIRKSQKDLPPISKKRIDEIKAIPDEKIDYSDIPELDDEFWQNAEWVEADKTLPLTIRVKESVLDYFKAGGEGLPDPDQCGTGILCSGANGIGPVTAFPLNGTNTR
jgi:uncharacterized protein (DUF4415 family)